MNAKEILIYLTETLLFYLEELSDIDKNAFTNGEKTAFVECLEILQHWNESTLYGLDFDIEGKYPI